MEDSDKKSIFHIRPITLRFQVMHAVVIWKGGGTGDGGAGDGGAGGGGVGGGVVAAATLETAALETAALEP